ncbi:hypothetical protein V2J09_000725, partial [Rumex salicifolius]
RPFSIFNQTITPPISSLYFFLPITLTVSIGSTILSLSQSHISTGFCFKSFSSLLISLHSPYIYLQVPTKQLFSFLPGLGSNSVFFISCTTRMDKNGKRSGQLRKIPAFGNWDTVNDMPITQYFESAHQAGLTRFSSSSGDTSSGDLYAAVVDHHHHHIHSSAPHRNMKGKGGEKRCPPHLKEAARGRQAVKVYNVPTVPSTNSKKLQNDVVQSPRVPPIRNRRAPKAVDEDLYKIPPELLHQTHKKKKLGFISRCLVMPCTA